MKLTTEQLEDLQRELNEIGVAVRTTEYSNGIHAVQFENSKSLSIQHFSNRVSASALIESFQKN